jgi:expansin (peptidoglycan-binding protein)
MTKDTFKALLAAAGTTEEDGALCLDAGRTMTLHLAHAGAQLSVSCVESLRMNGALVEAQDQKGQTHMFALGDLFATTCSAPSEQADGRSAGFRR